MNDWIFKYFQILQALKVACGHGFTICSVKFQDKKLLLGSGINTDSQIGYHEAPKGSGNSGDDGLFVHR